MDKKRSKSSSPNEGDRSSSPEDKPKSKRTKTKDFATGQGLNLKGKEVAQQENPGDSGETSKAAFKANEDQKRGTAALALFQHQDSLEGLKKILHNDYHEKYPEGDNRHDSAKEMYATLMDISRTINEHTQHQITRQKALQSIKGYLKTLEDNADASRTHEEVREHMQEFFEDLNLRMNIKRKEVAQQENPGDPGETSRATLKANEDQKRASAALNLINDQSHLERLKDMIEEYPDQSYTEEIWNAAHGISEAIDDMKHGYISADEAKQNIKEELESLEEHAYDPSTYDPHTHEKVREHVQRFLKGLRLR